MSSRLLLPVSSELRPPFSIESGHCYKLLLPELSGIADSLEQPSRSPLLLFEDGRLLGEPHSLHEDIRKVGRGLFSHWLDEVYFSASDNSDPNINGRTYVLRRRPLGRRMAYRLIGWPLVRPLRPPFFRVADHCFLVKLPELAALGDTLEQPYASAFDLFEDERMIGPPHSLHDDIITNGAGRFSHWGEALYFSTSDDSDPSTNGRSYSLRSRA